MSSVSVVFGHQVRLYSLSTMATKASTLNPIPQPPVVYSFAAADELKASLAKYIIDAQTDAINKKGRFSVAISGGSLPKMLSGLIGNKDVKWNKWYASLL